MTDRTAVGSGGTGGGLVTTPALGGCCCSFKSCVCLTLKTNLSLLLCPQSPFPLPERLYPLLSHCMAHFLIRALLSSSPDPVAPSPSTGLPQHCPSLIPGHPPPLGAAGRWL